MASNVVTMNKVYEDTIRKLENELNMYKKIVPETMLDNITTLKNEVKEKENTINQLNNENGTLKERVEQMNTQFNKAVEMQVEKNTRELQKRFDRLQKDYNGLYSGKIAGPQGRVSKALEREKEAKEREKSAIKELNVARLTIEEKDNLINDLEETLGNTKELLIKAETSLEYSKQQIEMLVEQKGMLESIINSLSVNSKKIDSIKVTSIPQTSNQVVSGVFKNQKDALDKLDKMVNLARLPVVKRGSMYVKKGKTQLADKYGLKDAQRLDNNIRTHINNGVYELIELYVEEGEQVTDKVKEAMKDDKYRYMDMDSILELLNNHKFENRMA